MITPMKAPYFAYNGGKARVRRFIVRWFPDQSTGMRKYVEPFAGRANVFFLARTFFRFKSWHLNDIQTIPFLEAVRRYKGEELKKVTKNDAPKLTGDMAEWMEPIIVWAGGLRSKGSYTNQRLADLRHYKINLEKSAELLQSAILTKFDALTLIKKEKLEEVDFVYIDWPYESGHVSSYDSDSFDREEFIHFLKTEARFKWALSEYHCEDLVEAFGAPTAEYHNVSINQPGDSPSRRETECLWTNYKASPLLLDFQSPERGTKFAFQLLEKSGSLTFDEFVKQCKQYKPHWKPLTHQAQFVRLCWRTDCYFDGECVTLLRKHRKTLGIFK